MPSVAPTMRAVLMSPEAVPERAGGRLATATALTGPVLNPSPAPITRRAHSINNRFGAGETNVSRRSPPPIAAMPAAMMMRAPRCFASAPE
jgi:hypothetical protein